MKSFDDFLSTLSAKDQEEIMQKSMSEFTKTGETFSERELRLAALISQISGIANRELLHRYHDWLSKQS